MTPRRYMPALLLLFVGSGCAALIYEIVWFQLLQLVIGSSAVSLAVLLGTFMGGMCLGSFLLPRYISAREHPLRVYAFMELGIGVFGLLHPVRRAGLWRTSTPRGAGSGPVGLVFRAVAASICLLPPTMLMGATLPAMSRWVETSPQGVSWLGFFYGGNTAGAVIGSLLAGFYLLRVHDMAIATYVAVALNVAVGALALLVARQTRVRRAPLAPRDKAKARVRRLGGLRGDRAVRHDGAGVAGDLDANAVAALRRDGLHVLAHPRGVPLRPRHRQQRRLGAGAQPRAPAPRARLGADAAVRRDRVGGLHAGAVAAVLADRPVDLDEPWYNFPLDLARAFWVVLPASILWGASFPLALASVAGKGQDPGRLVGGVYAANTVGAIVGAIGGSLLMVTWLGTQHSQQVLIILSGLAALLVLEPLQGSTTRRARARHGPARCRSSSALSSRRFSRATCRRFRSSSWPTAAMRRPAPPRTSTSSTWARAGTRRSRSRVCLAASSTITTPARSRRRASRRTCACSGCSATSRRSSRRARKKVLVIGCGAGVTAGAVSIDPDLEHETIAEIEPLVPKVVSTYFAEHNFSVVTNPKVHVQLDDARHYLMTTKEKFDAITSDPLDPWVKGAAMLYTREFFEIVKSHLNPGGVVTLFVQLYESNTAAVKSEIATFMEAFPNGVVWGNTQDGRGYDLVLMGPVEPLQINVDEIQAKLTQSGIRAGGAVARRSRDLLGDRSLRQLRRARPGPRQWTSDAIINRDRNLRLQYLAGLGLNLYQSDRIYSEMLMHAKYPDGLFTGSPATMQTLREAISRTQGRGMAP